MSPFERLVDVCGSEMSRLAEENTPKKQHYVPQYYLRRFSDDGCSLWVFNRKAGRTYKSRAEDVCERNYHYEMEARCQRSWHGRHLLPGKIEKKLSEIEGEQALLLREIDAQLDAGRIHEKERRALLWLVGHLIARHPAMLEGYEPDYDAMYGDPEVRWGCEVLAQAGMADEIEVLAQGANQMVLALWRCKGSPTCFAKSDLERLRCHFIRPQGEARFITSSLPPSAFQHDTSEGWEVPHRRPYASAVLHPRGSLFRHGADEERRPRGSRQRCCQAELRLLRLGTRVRAGGLRKKRGSRPSPCFRPTFSHQCSFDPKGKSLMT